MCALLIGWAGRDITPTRPVALRGQFNLRVATRVQDPLTLTALVIESDGAPLVIVSFDGVAVDEEIREGIAEKLSARLAVQDVPPHAGLDPRQVIVCATHTHTGPFAGTRIGLQVDTEYLDALRARYPDYMSAAEYSAFLVETLVDAVAEAWENRAPGQIAWGYSYAVVGENRRVRYFDDRAIMYGKVGEPDFSHIEGHVDHGVHMLFTYDLTQQLTGMIVNVACPSQASEGGQDYISADFWHDVRAEIRRRHGEALFILPQCSAAGDQSPHRQVDKRAEARMMRLKYGEGLSNGANFGLRQDLARRIADAVSDAEPAARQDLRAEAVLRHEPVHLELEHWNVTDAEYATLQAEMAQLQQRLDELAGSDPLSGEYTATKSRFGWCQRAAKRYEEPWPSVPIEMNVARLGDIAFVTAPFEYYLDYGDRIKGRSPAVQTFVVQLTGPGSYLPTARAAAGQSYGAVPASCRVSPAGGQMIVDEALARLAGMFA